MKIATWNVNSINARMPQLEKWLREAAPDVVCVQETKCVDEGFPYQEIFEMDITPLFTARNRITVSPYFQNTRSMTWSKGFLTTKRTHKSV